jgi:hypothetical protein
LHTSNSKASTFKIILVIEIMGNVRLMVKETGIFHLFLLKIKVIYYSTLYVLLWARAIN